MIAIDTADEQNFITKLVFDSSQSNNVWIGAERRPGNENEFKWSDGSSVARFANWAVGRPSDDVRRSCVQMQSELSSSIEQVPDLEWSDIACTVGNWFICQKLQMWPFENLQRAIISSRREMEYNVDSITDHLTVITTRLNNVNSELKYLHDNPSKFNKMFCIYCC